jgi:4-hydroxythreonine-4-phosphate dehydrogenase
MRRRLIISCGDVNGIGLRCFVGALQHAPLDADITLAISPSVLEQCIEAYGLPRSVTADAWQIGSNTVTIDALASSAVITPGMADDDVSRLAIASLERAIDSVGNGTADAMVTLPINKHALQQVGWTFPGQTEMVAACVGGVPLMVLCTHDVRVALATVHIPIRRVADALSISGILDRIRQLHDHVQSDVGIAQPRIAVLAIDPHAGDYGTIGDDDGRIVAPAIMAARTQRIDAHGPFPADGFFAFGTYRSFDGILAMDHDQGLIPLKVLAQGAGVNVTAGLRVVRTSPDHGTAYDRALADDVDAASTREALEMAVTIADRRANH